MLRWTSFENWKCAQGPPFEHVDIFQTRLRGTKMRNTKKTLIAVAIAVIVVFLIMHYWDTAAGVVGVALRAAYPLFLGCAMAYIANILMSFYERHYFPKCKKPFVRKSARPVCLIGALLTVAAVLLGVIRLVLPELADCVRIIVSQVPRAVDSIAAALYRSGIFSQEFSQYLQDIDWQGLIEWCVGVLTRGIGDAVTFAAGVVSSLMSTLVTVFIGLVFAINILLRRDKLKKQLSKMIGVYLPEKWHRGVLHVLTTLNKCFHSYIVGQFTEAIILGALCALGMMLLGFPYAAMTGAVVGVTALIPVAGAYVGGAVGFLLILTVSPLKAVLFVVYLVILQQLEGNLIYPKVVGSSVGLPGIWVLAAVTVGGGVMGILGMLIGVPLAATIYQLLREDINRRDKGRPLKNEGGDGKKDASTKV